MTTRRLAAILAADVVGFSKLVGEGRQGRERLSRGPRDDRRLGIP
jgi:hypothetical protein